MNDSSTDDLVSRNHNLLAEAELVQAQHRDLDAKVNAGMANMRATREYWRQRREATLHRPGAIYGPPFPAKAPRWVIDRECW